MSILDRVETENVFIVEGLSAARTGDKPAVMVYEGRDNYFRVVLSFDELRQLGREIIAKADELERELTFSAANTADEKAVKP